MQARTNYPALITAVQRKYAEQVKELIEAKENVNDSNRVGHTVLMYAVYSYDGPIFKQLLGSEGIKVNAVRNDGKTALMFAAKEKNVDAVAMLLAAGADLDIVDRDGKTAVTYALESGNLDVIYLLLKASKEPDNVELLQGLLKPTIINGHVGMLNLLLANPNVDVNAELGIGCNALICAVRNKHVEVIKTLIARSDINLNDVDNHGYTAVMWAAKLGSIDVVDMLLDAGADLSIINNYGHTAVTVATAEVAKYLMYAGKVLPSDSSPSDAIKKLDQMRSIMPCEYRDIDGYNFLSDIRIMLSSLEIAIKKNMSEDLPFRRALLEAKTCGVSFSDAITERYSGASMPEFSAVSSLMRTATITKMLSGCNPYGAIRIFKDSSSSLSNFPVDIKASILSFLTGRDVALKDMPVIDTPFPAPVLKLADSGVAAVASKPEESGGAAAKASLS